MTAAMRPETIKEFKKQHRSFLREAHTPREVGMGSEREFRIQEQRLQPFEAAEGREDGVMWLLELRSRTVREVDEESMSRIGRKRLVLETTRWVREERRGEEGQGAEGGGG
ncbi:hypothetical protein QJS10_CPA07g00879 [Acorus calamus]|uniref:Uncharacterized protein n=1 Tax=Acorus calamus TaxID=4465 RepID=A0AAV9EHM5_ACOCL|nr:hypothetical protein QJS10_CPA07g00879 [Acorus calamus]